MTTGSQSALPRVNHDKPQRIVRQSAQWFMETVVHRPCTPTRRQCLYRLKMFEDAPLISGFPITINAMFVRPYASSASPSTVM